jgi:hypothetical protein
VYLRKKPVDRLFTAQRQESVDFTGGATESRPGQEMTGLIPGQSPGQGRDQDEEYDDPGNRKWSQWLPADIFHTGLFPVFSLSPGMSLSMGLAVADSGPPADSNPPAGYGSGSFFVLNVPVGVLVDNDAGAAGRTVGPDNALAVYTASATNIAGAFHFSGKADAGGKG